VPVPPPSTPAARASRMALWALLTPVLVAGYELGLVETPAALLNRVAERLDEHATTYRPSSDAFVNPAKALALELSDAVPVVLGDGDVTGVAATRAVSMLARTARVPAMRGALPDDAGDVVATFGGPFAARPGDVFNDPYLDDPMGARLRLLFLRDAEPTVHQPDGTWLETSRTADAVRLTAEDGTGRAIKVIERIMNSFVPGVRSRTRRIRPRTTRPVRERAGNGVARTPPPAAE